MYNIVQDTKPPNYKSVVNQLFKKLFTKKKKQHEIYANLFDVNTNHYILYFLTHTKKKKKITRITKVYY